MIPCGPRAQLSTVTLVLIGANVLVFLYEAQSGPEQPTMNPFFAAYGIVSRQGYALSRSSLPCSSMAASCTSWEICGSSGSSEEALRTFWAT